MPVQFTQFVRPYGQPKPVSVDRSDGVALVARDLHARGVRLEIEVLVTGEVFMTAERTENGEPFVLANEIVDNGPSVLAAVDRLIERAWCVLLAEAVAAPPWQELS